MAEIREFRALVYNKEIAGPVENAIAPPYDVIDEEQQRELASSSPYNIVNIILPRNRFRPGDWQKTSSELFRSWKEQGALKALPNEAIYLYRQSFSSADGKWHDRLAIITLFQIEEDEQEVYPHERTFPEVISSQLSLLRSCGSNFSQIFMLFQDPPEYEKLLRERALRSGRKIFSFSCPQKIGHELLAIEDGGLIEELKGIFTKSRAFIADGHHRYEAARIYRNECREKTGRRERELPSDYVSVAFVGINDPGLVLLPVHRIFSCQGIDISIVLRDLRSCGNLTEVGSVNWRESVRHSLSEVISNDTAEPLFGVATREHSFLLKPDLNGKVTDEKGEPLSDAESELDVTVLHEFVLRSCRIEGAPLSEKCPIEYSVDIDYVIFALESGKADIAFLQRSPTLSQAWRMASEGRRMPHKSTYFYPKMLSGLVIYDHEAF